MSDTTQPGVRLDASTWKRFRQFVKQQHGGVRGNLRSELEAALENHMNASDGPDELERIENDVATIKAMLAQGEADGGVTIPEPTPSDGANTHTREITKPAANAPREKKVNYLIRTTLDENNISREAGEVPESEFRNIIESEYAFGDRITDNYVETIIDRLDAVQHPRHGATYVWGGRLEEEREKLRDEADQTLGE